MSETQWILLGIAGEIVVLAFLFRGSLKAGLEVLGIKASVEASNDLSAKPGDATAFPPPPPSGDTIIASGSRSFAAIEARGAAVNTGDNNTVRAAGSSRPRKK